LSNRDGKGTTIFGAIKKTAKRYFVDALSAMALGLFGSLIIGLILSQLGKIPGLSILSEFASVLSASSPVVGGAIGAAIAYGLGAQPLVIFSGVATGAFGYAMGGPVGAYLASLVGVEIARLVAGKTKVDIVVTPLTVIISGGFVGYYAGPAVSALMNGLGEVVGNATNMEPFWMGVIVATVVGMALTAPISSAALCITLWSSVLADASVSATTKEGIMLACGAACIGCSAQMVGFAVAGFRDNGWGGLISVGLGTSMLQVPNIVRHPQIWIAPTLAGAILGPVSTCLLRMKNTAVGAGMGTSGLVGQFGAFEAMANGNGSYHIMGMDLSFPFFFCAIVITHVILPGVLTFLFDLGLRKIGWVRAGMMTLPKLGSKAKE